MVAPIAVVVPAYGQLETTQTLVRDALREDLDVDVVVVDNMGDYASVGPEVVLRPGKNLGWLRGTNYGFEQCVGHGYSTLVALNNDTRLSRGFFAGMGAAVEAVEDVGLVAPCYDDVVAAQRWYYKGSPGGFVPQEHEQEVKLIDGTCFAMSLDTYHQVGRLDERYFGRRGWGAMEDYCIRVRNAGLKVVVTRRAYLTHDRGLTAHATQGAYERYAVSEFRRGMRRKWGADWRQHFDAGMYREEEPRDRARDLLRHVEDRLGLSNTAVGRRAPRSTTDAQA